MTLDLFADDPIAAPPPAAAPAPAQRSLVDCGECLNGCPGKCRKAAPPPAAPKPGKPTVLPQNLQYMMEPITEKPNRWNWRAPSGIVVEIGCDMKLEGKAGHWFTVQPINGKKLQSDRRVQLFKDITAEHAKS